MTFSSLCEDAQAVMDHAVSMGFSRFAVLGTRVGALIAAGTVALMPSVPLALWEPVSDPLSLITAAQRAKRISQTARGDDRDVLDWREELDQSGTVDLLGYDVYPALVDSLKDVHLLTSIGAHPRKIFVARFRGNTGTKDPMKDALIEKGFSVESGFFDLSESWWFQSERVSSSGDLVPATTTWLANVLSDMS